MKFSLNDNTFQRHLFWRTGLNVGFNVSLGVEPHSCFKSQQRHISNDLKTSVISIPGGVRVSPIIDLIICIYTSWSFDPKAWYQTSRLFVVSLLCFFSIWNTLIQICDVSHLQSVFKAVCCGEYVNCCQIYVSPPIAQIHTNTTTLTSRRCYFSRCISKLHACNSFPPRHLFVFFSHPNGATGAASYTGDILVSRSTAPRG